MLTCRFLITSVIISGANIKHMPRRSLWQSRSGDLVILLQFVGMMMKTLNGQFFIERGNNMAYKDEAREYKVCKKCGQRYYGPKRRTCPKCGANYK